MPTPDTLISCEKLMTIIQDDKSLKDIFGTTYSASYLSFYAQVKSKKTTDPL